MRMVFQLFKDASYERNILHASKSPYVQKVLYRHKTHEKKNMKNKLSFSHFVCNLITYLKVSSVYI